MSDSEFRRLSADRRVQFQQVVDYAFHAEDGPQQYDGPDSTPDRQGQRYGVFADDELRSVCTHYDFTASLRGEWAPVAGLASVATAPEYRRQGHVGRLVDGSLRAWRGDYPLAALWPFEFEYYERFGWAIGCTVTEYTCDPETLAFARDAPGTLRRVDPDDWERLQEVHERYGLEHDLTVRRDERWWRQRVFRRFGDRERYVYALERDGEVRGYVAYTVESEGGDRRLVAIYNAFADTEAYRGLLGLLADHDSQVDEVVLYRPAETSLFDLTAEPKAIDCEFHPGTMVRVVDVVDALETIPYPDGVAGSLTLAVDDDTAAWNDGQFELAVSDGQGACRRLEDGDSNPDARVDIQTLSQLVVGYHSVEEARELADLQVAGEDVATRLGEWFPPRTVSPMDNF